MSAFRLCWLFILFTSSGFAAPAQEYNRPRGVDVLSEAGLFNQFAGNSVSNQAYTEYYLPPEPGQKRGRLRGKSETYGLYEGGWKIDGELFCIEYEMRLMSALGNCYTAAQVGDEIRIYRRDGYELYPDGGRLRPRSGNPENL